MSYMETASLKKSVKVPLAQVLNGVTLSSFTDGALFASSRVMSEGAIVDGDEGERVYAGSTMVSIRLRGGEEPLLDIGPLSSEELLGAVRRSIGFRVRLLRLARAEAERRCAPFLLREMRTEPVFRIDDGVLFVDIDVECPLAAPWSGEDDAGRGAP
jgi:hypothetical protein